MTGEQRCPDCDGTGRRYYAREVTDGCDRCNATGTIQSSESSSASGRGPRGDLVSHGFVQRSKPERLSGLQAAGSPAHIEPGAVRQPDASPESRGEGITADVSAIVRQLRRYFQHEQQCHVMDCATCGHHEASHLDFEDGRCHSVVSPFKPERCDCLEFVSKGCTCGLDQLADRLSVLVDRQEP